MSKIFFIAVHIGCISVIWVGISPIAVGVCLLLYLVRMFGITAGYHRLFSHRTYKTTRAFQFLLACVGSAAAQKGPIWWAANHRHHHKHSDTDEDIHSPGIQGIWWAHAGWVLSDKGSNRPDMSQVRDLTALPELRFLDRYELLLPAILFGALYALGAALDYLFPSLKTSGFQMLVWGGLVSTVLVYHGTFAINSFAHLIGRRRFETGDASKNSLILALITLGEGWHNNHHRYPGSERQGFYWWEIDICHYILLGLAKLGIVWDLRTPPARVYAEAASGTQTLPSSPSLHGKA